MPTATPALTHPSPEFADKLATWLRDLRDCKLSRAAHGDSREQIELWIAQIETALNSSAATKSLSSKLKEITKDATIENIKNWDDSATSSGIALHNQIFMIRVNKLLDTAISIVTHLPYAEMSDTLKYRIESSVYKILSRIFRYAIPAIAAILVGGAVFGVHIAGLARVAEDTAMNSTVKITQYTNEFANKVNGYTSKVDSLNKRAENSTAKITQSTNEFANKVGGYTTKVDSLNKKAEESANKLSVEISGLEQNRSKLELSLHQEQDQLAKLRRSRLLMSLLSNTSFALDKIGIPSSLQIAYLGIGIYWGAFLILVIIAVVLPLAIMLWRRAVGRQPSD